MGVLNDPSLTVTVMLAVPFWLAAGVTVTVRLAPLPPNTMFPLGTSVGLFETSAHRQTPRRRLRIPDRKTDRSRGCVLIRLPEPLCP